MGLEVAKWVAKVLVAGYADCNVEQLDGTRSRCEHEATRRFYESCTLA